MKHYLKLYKSKNYEELRLNIKKSITNIMKDHYKNYFIYAYNKDYYKNKKSSKKSSKHRKSTKIKNWHLKYAPL
jgi:ABC-type Fe3+ transport system substrate-binding protein